MSECASIALQCVHDGFLFCSTLQPNAVDGTTAGSNLEPWMSGSFTLSQLKHLSMIFYIQIACAQFAKKFSTPRSPRSNTSMRASPFRIGNFRVNICHTFEYVILHTDSMSVVFNVFPYVTFTKVKHFNACITSGWQLRLQVEHLPYVTRFSAVCRRITPPTQSKTGK